MITRTWQHREGPAAGSTKRYGLKSLVWYEAHENAISTVTREKQLKKWRRAWKIELIEQNNRDWRDLYDDIIR